MRVGLQQRCGVGGPSSRAPNATGGPRGRTLICTFGHRGARQPRLRTRQPPPGRTLPTFLTSSWINSPGAEHWLRLSTLAVRRSVSAAPVQLMTAQHPPHLRRRHPNAHCRTRPTPPGLASVEAALATAAASDVAATGLGRIDELADAADASVSLEAQSIRLLPPLCPEQLVFTVVLAGPLRDHLTL